MLMASKMKLPPRSRSTWRRMERTRKHTEGGRSVRWSGPRGGQPAARRSAALRDPVLYERSLLNLPIRIRFLRLHVAVTLLAWGRRPVSRIAGDGTHTEHLVKLQLCLYFVLVLGFTFLPFALSFPLRAVGLHTRSRMHCCAPVSTLKCGRWFLRLLHSFRGLAHSVF